VELWLMSHLKQELEAQSSHFHHNETFCQCTVMELLKALLGKSTLNTFQHMHHAVLWKRFLLVSTWTIAIKCVHDAHNSV
jgi:hypothetical protein